MVIGILGVALRPIKPSTYKVCQRFQFISTPKAHKEVVLVKRIQLVTWSKHVVQVAGGAYLLLLYKCSSSLV